MPRVETIRLVITTGKTGHGSDVQIKFNGHQIPLVKQSGGTGPGQTYEGTFDVGSVCHSCTLLGPEQGEWHVQKVVASFEGAETRKNEFGEKVLKAGEELNVWDPPPPPAFDV